MVVEAMFEDRAQLAGELRSLDLLRIRARRSADPTVAAADGPATIRAAERHTDRLATGRVRDELAHVRAALGVLHFFHELVASRLVVLFEDAGSARIAHDDPAFLGCLAHAIHQSQTVFLPANAGLSGPDRPTDERV